MKRNTLALTLILLSTSAQARKIPEARIPLVLQEIERTSLGLICTESMPGGGGQRRLMSSQFDWPSLAPGVGVTYRGRYKGRALRLVRSVILNEQLIETAIEAEVSETGTFVEELHIQEALVKKVSVNMGTIMRPRYEMQEHRISQTRLSCRKYLHR